MLRDNIWSLKIDRPYLNIFYQELNIPLINKMIEDKDLLTKENYQLFDDKYADDFISTIYPNCNYKQISDKLLEFVPIIEKSFPKFNKLNKNWGFKLFDEYNVAIDYHGAGGRYNSNTGLISLGAWGGDKLPTQKSIGTIIHEMAHLGIEDNIIKKYNLPQEEKERIVDNLCIYAMDGIIDAKRMKDKNAQPTAFQNVAQYASYMDKVVGNQPENNLDKAVEKFVNDKSIARYHLDKLLTR